MNPLSLRYRLSRTLFHLAARIYPMDNKRRSGFGHFVGQTNRWLDVSITKYQETSKVTTDLAETENMVARSGRWSR